MQTLKSYNAEAARGCVLAIGNFDGVHRGHQALIKTAKDVATDNDAPLAVTPPNFVILQISETDPGVRGDTSGGGSKPATLETGAVVKVPLFLSQGEVIRVDTRTGEYQGRAGKS